MEGFDHVDIESIENSLLISINNPSANKVILEIVSQVTDKKDHFNLNLNNVIKLYYQRYESSVQREGFHNFKRIKLSEGNSEWINHFENWENPFNNETGFELLLYNGSILRFVGENISLEKQILEDIQTMQDLESVPDKVQETTAKIVSNTSFMKKQVREQIHNIKSSEEHVNNIQDDELPLEDVDESITDRASDFEKERDSVSEKDSMQHYSEDQQIVEEVQQESITFAEEKFTEFEKDEKIISEIDSAEDVEPETFTNEVLESPEKEDEIILDADPVEDLEDEELSVVEDVSTKPSSDMDEFNYKEEEIISNHMEVSSLNSAIEPENNNHEDLAKFKEAIVTEETINKQSEDESSQFEYVESIKDKPKDLLTQITEGEAGKGFIGENSLEETTNESDILRVDGVNKINQKSLLSLKYDTIENLANAKIAQLAKINGIGKVTARKIIASAKDLLQDENKL